MGVSFMATPTYSELLAAAKTALLDVLANGQHVSLDGRVFTKADLDALRKQIDWLETKAGGLSTSGGVFDRMRVGGVYRA
jgi:hypothetical protein